MSVEQKIIDNSNNTLKALAPKALKAFNAPDTGIKIVLDGAYFVIRDCADITVKYLPLYLYGTYSDPVKQLQGVFTKEEIASFVERAMNIQTPSIQTNQLCTLMLNDSRNQNGVIMKSQTPENSNEDDVYGEYGSDSVGDTNKELEFDLRHTSDIIHELSVAFSAK